MAPADDTTQAPTLVALATAWGPRHCGVNAFNIEWLCSLGIMPRRRFELICVVPGASDTERQHAARHHVQLLDLGRGKTRPTCRQRPCHKCWPR